RVSLSSVPPSRCNGSRCLGRLERLCGHSRVPEPPAMINPYSMEPRAPSGLTAATLAANAEAWKSPGRDFDTDSPVETNRGPAGVYAHGRRLFPPDAIAARGQGRPPGIPDQVTRWSGERQGQMTGARRRLRAGCG